MKKRTYPSYILWIVIIISIISIFFSPTKPIVEQLKRTLPWVALGITISEITLTVGFLMMLWVAAPAFVKKLHRSAKAAIWGLFHVKEEVEELDWSHVANRCHNSRFFWVGFWISVVGASGDGIVLIAAIGRTLPLTSWGLMILPFWDLGLTFIIRRSIYKGIHKHKSTGDQV